MGRNCDPRPNYPLTVDKGYLHPQAWHGRSAAGTAAARAARRHAAQARFAAPSTPLHVYSRDAISPLTLVEPRYRYITYQHQYLVHLCHGEREIDYFPGSSADISRRSQPKRNWVQVPELKWLHNGRWWPHSTLGSSPPHLPLGAVGPHVACMHRPPDTYSTTVMWHRWCKRQDHENMNHSHALEHPQIIYSTGTYLVNSTRANTI